MKRVEHEHVESRLRSEKPGAMEAPSWVRTRVIASMDAEQNERVVHAAGTRLVPMAISGGVLAAVALGVVLWVLPTRSAPNDEAWQSGGTVKISLPDAIRVPGPTALEQEAEHLREDFVDLLGVIRVPAAKLSEASKRFKGSV